MSVREEVGDISHQSGTFLRNELQEAIDSNSNMIKLTLPGKVELRGAHVVMQNP